MFDLSPLFGDFLFSKISVKEAFIQLMEYADPKGVDEIQTFDTEASIQMAKEWFEEGMARYMEMPQREVLHIALDDGCDYYYFEAYACEGAQAGVDKLLESGEFEGEDDPIDWDTYPSRLAHKESADLPLDLEAISETTKCAMVDFVLYQGIVILGALTAIKDSHLQLGASKLEPDYCFPLLVSFLDSTDYIASLTSNGWVAVIDNILK